MEREAIVKEYKRQRAEEKKRRAKDGPQAPSKLTVVSPAPAAAAVAAAAAAAATMAAAVSGQPAHQQSSGDHTPPTAGGWQQSFLHAAQSTPSYEEPSGPRQPLIVPIDALLALSSKQLPRGVSSIKSLCSC